jgi:hypothetical protein
LKFRGLVDQIIVRRDVPFQLKNDTLFPHDENIGDIGFGGNIGQVDDPFGIGVFVNVGLAWGR